MPKLAGIFLAFFRGVNLNRLDDLMLVLSFERLGIIAPALDRRALGIKERIVFKSHDVIKPLGTAALGKDRHTDNALAGEVKIGNTAATRVGWAFIALG